MLPRRPRRQRYALRSRPTKSVRIALGVIRPQANPPARSTPGPCWPRRPAPVNADERELVAVAVGDTPGGCPRPPARPTSAALGDVGGQFRVWIIRGELVGHRGPSSPIRAPSLPARSPLTRWATRRIAASPTPVGSPPTDVRPAPASLSTWPAPPAPPRTARRSSRPGARPVRPPPSGQQADQPCEVVPRGEHSRNRPTSVSRAGPTPLHGVDRHLLHESYRASAAGRSVGHMASAGR
jgi:hypothetical protein